MSLNERLSDILGAGKVVGSYATNHRTALVAAQAANSRLFEVRNTSATLLLVPTRLDVKWLQTAAHTAQIEDSLDVFRCTAFTAVDTVNTVTPGNVPDRSAYAAATAAIRGCTIAGAAAGMTGGTLTKDASSLAEIPQMLQAAVPTAGPLGAIFENDFGLDLDDEPTILAQNEGLELENRVLLGAAAGSDVYITFAWVEFQLN